MTRVKNVLTRASGYLEGVASHSLQPYRGCSYGRHLCGVGCYVQHNPWITRGRPWGSFLEVRENAAESYLEHAPRERQEGRRRHGAFTIFMSSSTDPFVPQERRLGISQAVLEAMGREPPDLLILQTHHAQVAEQSARLARLGRRFPLRVHLSVETDREQLPGLPPHACSVASRLEAARTLGEAGVEVWITVSPLLPIRHPEAFFAELSLAARAVVLDPFLGGDGTPDGRRTRKTPLPGAMEALAPGSTRIGYASEMLAVARRFFPGRVGLGAPGFAGRFLPAPISAPGPEPDRLVGEPGQGR